MIFLIKIYKRFISPLFPDKCKYYPSCSTYFIDALKNKGYFKGFIIGTYRILRCNPFSKGGVDEVK